MSKPKKDAISEMINGAVSNPDIPKIYANGFVTGIGNGGRFDYLAAKLKPRRRIEFFFHGSENLGLEIGRTDQRG